MMIRIKTSFAVGAVLVMADNDDSNQRFIDYCTQHGKSYLDEAEFQQRKQIWQEMDQFIQEQNESNASF